MQEFCYPARSFGTLCLIVLLSIAIQIEMVSETATASQDKTTGLGDESNTVRSLVIKGNDSFSEQQIRALMRTDVWSVYDEAVLAADFEAIISFYKEKGYRFARVVEAQNYVKKFEDGVYLGFEIDEGIIGKITVSGNTHTRENVILQELLFQEGDVYIEADKAESERILRQKTYIGSANIIPQWNVSLETVTLHVNITDLWSLKAAFDPLPLLNPEGGKFLLAGKDYNLLGSGHFMQFSYEGEIEREEENTSLHKR